MAASVEVAGAIDPRVQEWLDEVSLKVPPAASAARWRAPPKSGQRIRRDKLWPTCDPAQASSLGDTRELTTDAGTAWGRLTYLTPCVEMSETPPAWLRLPVPLGTHPASWPTSN